MVSGEPATLEINPISTSVMITHRPSGVQSNRTTPRSSRADAANDLEVYALDLSRTDGVLRNGSSDCTGCAHLDRRARTPYGPSLLVAERAGENDLNSICCMI